MGADFFDRFHLEGQMRDRKSPPAYEAGFRSMKGGKGFGDVIVPGKAFLVEQGPQ